MNDFFKKLSNKVLISGLLIFLSVIFNVININNWVSAVPMSEAANCGVPQGVINLGCDYGCGARCGRVWFNNAGTPGSMTVTISAASGWTEVDTYGVLKTCSKAYSGVSYSRRLKAVSDFLWSSPPPAEIKIKRDGVKKRYEIGCPRSKASGFWIDNAVIYNKLKGVSGTIEAKFKSTWWTTSGYGNEIEQKSWIYLEIKKPPVATLSVNGGTTNSYDGLKIGDKIIFTHTGRTNCTTDPTGNASCNNKVSFFRGSSPNNPIAVVTYNQETGSKNIEPDKEEYVIGPNDLGNKICRHVSWSVDGGELKNGNNSCVDIPKPTLVITPSGSTTVDKENIVPGTKATFKHKTSAKVETNYDGSNAELYFYVIDATTTGDLLPGAQWRARTIRSETISSQTQNLPEASATTDFQAKDSDLGKTVCRRIWWEIFDKNLNPEKKVYDGPGYKWGWGGNVACTTIPYNYTLVPNITLDGQVGERSTPPGSEHEVTGKITNNGPTLSKAYQWQITRFNYSPGIKPPTEISHNNHPPAANFCSQPTAKDCEAIKSGTSQSGLPNKAIAELVQTGSLKLQVPLNAQPGSRYCVALSVQPYQALSDNWAHSRPVCVVVAKTPSTQIHGTNLLVPQGRVIAKSAIFNHIGNAPTPICPHNIKGCAFTSWGEYDILARGEIAGLSSNSGSLINNHETDPSSSNFWHQLSFANDPLPGNFVASSSSGLVVNRAQKISNFFLSQAKSTPNLVASQLTINDLNLEANKLNFVRHQGSNLSLKGSLAAGQSLIVIQESGDLIINGNLEYPAQDNITHPSQYAQLVLIVKDGNLVINDNVTRVDAWLIATGQNSKQGRLKTCNYQAVSSTVCHHPLRINGPVMTDYLDLLRTYGAEYPVSINQPAEVFNFRPDAYLWLINQTQSRNIFRTTLIKNAAPRY